MITRARVSGSGEAVYRHTQVSWISYAATFVVVAFTGTMVLPVAPVPATLLMVFFILVGAVFSSLTVEVADGALRTAFGMGVWRKRFPLAEITDARVTRTRWWEGWGIRITPRGMLYNVAGLDAVEITLGSGERVRIGTDEPDLLLLAIQGARG